MTLLGASVVGRSHLFRETNAQDAFAIAQATPPSTCGVGVVCDGCGAEPRSEIGAVLLSSAIAAAALERIARGEGAGAAARAAGADALGILARIAAATAGRDVDAFVRAHLLTTLLVLVDDGATLAVATWGDGVVAFDDERIVIDEGGAPRYLAYALLDGEVAPPPSFAREAASAAVRRAAIASDGLTPALVGGCFGHRGRGLQRYLNVQARSAALDDDATIIVRELDEGTAS